ncbi:rho GTPase-activating protein 100F-like [Ptychodera flava]|uniref:rho GTPase-activating protein 100F-like n=1 Tax=Ptychodera flava TaxID=63121 RepID=UPI00396A3657
MESGSCGGDVAAGNDEQNRDGEEPSDHHVLQVRRVAGISSELVRKIQAAEDLAANMDKEDRDSDSLSGSSVSTVTIEGKQIKSSVIQEREIQGGAYVLRTVEINKIQGETLGIYITEGDGFAKKDGIFISRLALGSVCDQNGLVQVGDEILSVNNVDVTRMNLDEVCHVMKIPSRLLITVKTRRVGKSKRNHGSVDSPVDRKDLDEKPRRESETAVHKYVRSKSSEPQRPSTAPSSIADHSSRHHSESSIDSREHLPQISKSPRLKQRSKQQEADDGGRLSASLSGSSERVSPVDDFSRGWDPTSPHSSGRNSLERERGNSANGGTVKPPEVVIIGSEEHATPHKKQKAKTQRPSSRPKSAIDLFDNETKFIDDDDLHDISTRPRERAKNQRYSTLSPHMSHRATISPTNINVSGNYDALTSPRYIRKGVNIPSYSWDDSLPELTIGMTRPSRKHEHERPKSPQSFPTTDTDDGVAAKEKPKRQIRKYMGSKSDVSPMRKQRGKSDGGESANPARYLWQRLHWSKGDSRPVAMTSDFADVTLPDIAQSSQYEEQLLSPRELKDSKSKRDIPKSPEPMGRIRRVAKLDGPSSSQERQPTLDDNADLVEQQKMSMMLQSMSKGRKVSKTAQTKVSGRPDIRSDDSLDADGTITPEQSIDEEDGKCMSKSGKVEHRSSVGKPLEIDLTGFMKYRRDSQPKVKGDIFTLSGILSLRIHGGRKLATLRNQSRELFCVVEVDSEAKARTYTVTAKDEFTWDENFEIELENSTEINIMVYCQEGDSKCKICYKGILRLVPLFRDQKNAVHQLALKLEPRGLLYLSMSFTESTVTLKRTPSMNRSGVFGVSLESVVRRERTGMNVPLLVQKCVKEIEDRGLEMIGVYRVCGSAKRKKSLKGEFDQNSAAVDISPENCPDINVITGCLKDYLRELPEPLFTNSLCQKLMDILMKPEADPKASAELVLKLMSDLPQANQDTLEYLLDHLKLISAHSDSNKMNNFNLAVCFGPVLMSPTPSSDRDYKAAVDFEKHIEVLQHLLDIWPEKEERVAIKTRLTEKSVKNKNGSQEDDSCYHSIDDLDDAPTTAKAEENWDSENLEVSAC